MHTDAGGRAHPRAHLNSTSVAELAPGPSIEIQPTLCLGGKTRASLLFIGHAGQGGRVTPKSPTLLGLHWTVLHAPALCIMAGGSPAAAGAEGLAAGVAEWAETVWVASTYLCMAMQVTQRPAADRGSMFASWRECDCKPELLDNSAAAFGGAAAA